MIDIWDGGSIIDDLGIEVIDGASAVPKVPQGEFVEGAFLDDDFAPVTPIAKVTDHDVEVDLEGDVVRILSTQPLTNERDFEYFMGLHKVVEVPEGVFGYRVTLRPINAYLMFFFLKGRDVFITPEAAAALSVKAKTVPKPSAKLTSDGKHIEVMVPSFAPYDEIVKTFDAYPSSNSTWRLLTTRIFDFETMVREWDHCFPPIALSDEIVNFSREEIPGYDGTIEKLKVIPASVLNVVQTNHQSYKSRKKSDKPFEEKLKEFGVSTLYDLITLFPRKYIDKSNPQDLSDLVIDEPATILGIVDSVNTLPSGRDIVFRIRMDDSGGRLVSVTFWQQPWLKAKFGIGSEVLVTGKFYMWRGNPSLNGTSIEHAKEASLLPIVPVYKQSESKGITSAVLFAAEREMLSRMKRLTLPRWLDKPDRMDYYEAFNEIHVPSTMEKHDDVMTNLGYYELVMNQILVQEKKRSEASFTSVPLTGNGKNYQELAISTLPYELTAGQKRAVAYINEKIGTTTPSNVLLNADVGSGKTIIAQLLCLRAVESGKQAVFVAPTAVLATQLHATFARLLDSLNKLLPEDERIELTYLSSSLKAAEKKKVLKGIEDGSIDIVVGTHNVFSPTVTYHDLGFVAIDEQQKFGVVQRTKLLNVREDGNQPHIYQQTGTPIARSMAQAVYGDVDMIVLKDKPAERKEIITKLFEENSNDFIEELINPVWNDVIMEANESHQSFVITPMISDSERVEAASVERTFKELQKGALAGLRLGMVHGRMKPAEQDEVMEAFHNKEYDVLVASPVVEVGVDIPDATRVVILSAERLGASQLHQIRGRVGRNALQSKCYLVSLCSTDSARSRMDAMVEHSDGFSIAEIDLGTRGTGSIFGTNQSGASNMIFGSIYKHKEWLEQAKAEAADILASPLADEAIAFCQSHFGTSERLL